MPHSIDSEVDVPAQFADSISELRLKVRAKEFGIDAHVENIAVSPLLLQQGSGVGQVLEATPTDALFLCFFGGKGLQFLS